MAQPWDQCAACGKSSGELLPYSIAHRVIAWMHRRCSRIALDAGWREQYAAANRAGDEGAGRNEAG